jgi:thioredoxin reductase (NADPH)
MLQARKFGAQFAVPAEAKSVRWDDGQYVVTLDDGTSVTATAVVAASGARYRRLEVPRTDYFERMSIYYAASQAEALMCRGDPVIIVGGGNSAGQAAAFLSRHASRVTVVVPGAGPVRVHVAVSHRSGPRIANVDIILGTEIRELLGDRALEAVTVEDRQSGAQRTLKARALFAFIGVSPCTGWLGGTDSSRLASPGTSVSHSARC